MALRVISGFACTRRTSHMKAILWLIFCAANLTGCASSWPADMPSTTYSGTIIDQASGRKVPDATITAFRLSVTDGLLPGQPFVPMDPGTETMAETRSNKDGEFILTTRSGYAQRIEAISADHSMTGGLNQHLEQGGKNLTINLTR